MKPITLPREIVNRLLTHAQQSPASEVCGLIGRGESLSVYPVANVAEDPARLFLLDAQGQLDAMREMRERGEELFAIYHSHPTAPAEPSARDQEMANYPDALYLIVSLNTKGVLELRGFRCVDGSLQPVELMI